MPTAARRVAPDPHPCRGQDCTHPVYARGLCRGHYSRQPAGEPEDLSPLGRWGEKRLRVAFRLTPEAIAVLEAAAAAGGVSPGQVVESAILQLGANLAPSSAKAANS